MARFAELAFGMSNHFEAAAVPSMCMALFKVGFSEFDCEFKADRLYSCFLASRC
jgi:hypothetical protein